MIYGDKQVENIIIDSSMIKTYACLETLCENAGKNEEFRTVLWAGLLADNSLMDEFIYYLENKTVKDNLKIRGYSLTDMYVYCLGRYNLYSGDLGKNTASCNKETMILDAFMCMHRLNAEPDVFIKILNEGRGMDRM